MVVEQLDALVVGGGTAGANAAYQLARRGRRVLLVERRTLDEGGAQWVNGVLDRHFEEADLEPPTGAERGLAGNLVHLRARDPKVGPTIVAPAVAADMGLLGRRLRKLAAEAGAELLDEVERVSVEVDASGRPSAVTLRRSSGSERVVAPRLVVDASGRQGVVRRQIPALAEWCPPVEKDELCSASDAHHEILDPAGAEEFLARHGAELGDAVTYVGLSGGFSTCAVTISEGLDSVGVLVGCLANGRYGNAPKMIADLREREPWIGPALRTGTGVIPLRRPYARLTAAGAALVGDAACQVFPAHGSGIGVGLVAGTMLAEGVAAADDPGDPEVLWRGYQAAFHQRLGADLAGYDALRRGTTAMGSDGVDAMVRSGAIGETTTRVGLEQRWATPPPRETLRSAVGLARNPRLARIMVPSLARAQVARIHAGRYPTEPDLEALAQWDRRMTKILGPLPA